MLDLTPWWDRTVDQAQALLDDVVAVQGDWAAEFVSRFGQDRDAMLLDGSLESLIPAWEWFMENLQLEPIEIELPETIERIEEAFGGLDLHPWMLVKRGGLQAGGSRFVWLSSYLAAYWCGVMSSVAETSWRLGTDKEVYNEFLFFVGEYEVPFPPSMVASMAVYSEERGLGPERLLERSVQIMQALQNDSVPEVEAAWSLESIRGGLAVCFPDEIAHEYEDYVLMIEQLLSAELPEGAEVLDGDREFIGISDNSSRSRSQLRGFISQLLTDRAPDPRPPPKTQGP